MSAWAIATWASFLGAALLEAVVFSLVDPAEIHRIGATTLPSRVGVYSVAFFLFWIQGMFCASLAMWLARKQSA
jgi:hypothetical protein